MAFFTVNANQDINDMLAYDMYRSFQSAFETLKQNGGTLKDLEAICDSFIPIDALHPDTIDTPIPDIKDCKGNVVISCKYSMIGIALVGHINKEPNIQDFTLADAYHAFYKDALTKQYYFHEMKEKYQLRDMVLTHPEKVTEDPLMRFIEKEVPYRLNDIFDIENPNQEMIDAIVQTLQENTDLLFHYDQIDNLIMDCLNTYQEEHGTKSLDELLSDIENKSTYDSKQKTPEKTHKSFSELSDY